MVLIEVMEEPDKMCQQSGAQKPVSVFVSHLFTDIARDVIVHLGSFRKSGSLFTEGQALQGIADICSYQV